MVRLLAGATDFSLLQSTETSSGAHTASHWISNRRPFPVVKQLGAWGWSFTSIYCQGWECVKVHIYSLYMPSQHTALPSPLLCTVKVFQVEGSKNQSDDRWDEWIEIYVIYFQKYSLIMDPAELFLAMHSFNLYFQWTKRGWLPWQGFATWVYQLYWLRPVMIFSIPPKKFWVNIQIMP